MKSVNPLTGGVALALALALTPMAMAATQGSAESKPAADFAETVAKTTTETEEVIVSGRLDSLSAIVKAIETAEDRFLYRYNDLNDDWQYDVTCHVEAPTGRRITMRRCETGYVAEAKRQNVVYGLLQYGTLAWSPVPEWTIAQSHLKEFQAKMRQVVENDVELQRALVERSLLIERYEKIRKKKFEEQWIVWD